MALLVWLPLNGNLKNLGLADINLINSGATISSEGKIGLCYSFDGSDDYLYTSNYTNLGNNFSVACWVYFNIISTGCILCTRSATYSGLFIYLSSGNMEIDPTASSFSNGVNRWTTTFAPQTKTWYHLVITRTPTEISYYINGELLLTKTVTYGDNYGNTLTIGCRSTNGGSRGVFLNGKLNDLRIYDHCLSPKEVKEISKGLVLHYKLNQPLSENVEIPLSIVSHDSTRTGSEDVTKAFDNSISTKWFEAAKHVTNIIVETISNLPANKLALYPGNDNHLYNSRNLGQFDIYGSNDNVNYNLLYSCNDTYYGTVPSIWYYYNFYNDINYKYYKFVTIGRSAGIQIGEIKLFFEQLTSYDYSGYKHDGIIQGTATIDNNNNTPRYNKCINLVNSSIACPLFQFPEVTISFWINRNSLTNSRQFIYTGWYGISIEFTAGNGWLIYYTIDSSATTKRCNPTTVLLPNQWYHVVFIIGISGVRSYINGVCEKTETYTTPYYSTTNAYIGLYSTIRNFNAKLSDFRIYSTALSDEDIKELYNTSAIVDNFGNDYCYEFEELMENIELNPPLDSFNHTSGVSQFDGKDLVFTGSGSSYSNFIEVDVSKTLTYDITFSNQEGSWFLIGFERYDENKATVSNSGCIYVTSATTAADHRRISGILTLADVNGNPCKFTKIRVLNCWGPLSTITGGVGKIHSFHFTQSSGSGNLEITELGLIKGGWFIEDETLQSLVSKNKYITANQLIEI